jgi:hypothetical protein
MNILIAGKLLLIGITLGGIFMLLTQFRDKNHSMGVSISSLPKLLIRFFLSVVYFSIIFIFVFAIVALIR